MAKNTFATLGIFVVLLLSFGLTSAAVANFELNIVGDGTTSSRLTGTNNSANPFTVSVNNTDTILDFYVNWTVATTTTMTLPSGANYSKNTNTSVSTFDLTMPYKSSSYVRLTANIYYSNGTTKLGTEYVNVYFNNTDYVAPVVTNITGCTNTTATNYNPSATVDDGSCTYSTTTPSDTFCELDSFGTEKGHLEISEVEVTNNGVGDDEEWEYLDEIVIEVTVENTDDDNINDVMVEIMITDSNDKVISRKDMDLDQDEDDLGRINDDDEEIATFKIDELPIDLENGDYKLYIRAYEDGNEDNECVSESEDFTNTAETYFEFEIVSSDKATVIVKQDIANVKASCGDDNVEVRFMVYNTGSDDEDQILVTLENSKLGIYEKYIIENLRDGKGKEAVFYITVPAEVAKSYEKLEIYTYYDYDDDEEDLDEHSYGESSEDEGDDFSMLLEILSCQAPEPTVTANLDSVAIVGEDLIVKARVTNQGESNNFIISASGFESWAKLVSIDPQSASINKGEFQEVTITLSPTVAGEQSFKINTVADGTSYEQTVSLSIAEEEGMFGFNMSSLMFYAIIGIVALVVLIFLVLIVKISKRSPSAQF